MSNQDNNEDYEFNINTIDINTIDINTIEPVNILDNSG